jgi:hypothetical protein
LKFEGIFLTSERIVIFHMTSCPKCNFIKIGVKGKTPTGRESAITVLATDSVGNVVRRVIKIKQRKQSKFRRKPAEGGSKTFPQRIPPPPNLPGKMPETATKILPLLEI